MNTKDKEEKEIQNLPQLIKGSSIYKLIVPKKVEEKIRYLLRKFPHTEWSGVLFTTHEGSFENNNLVVTCQDIYPMDLGDATFTKFTMNEDVAGYMAENIELFDCDLQLVHSHHCMATTASGTDINTLREEGNERNCFVSLIVNNAGTYSAYITRKLQTKHEVTIKKLGQSYEFFGDGEIETDVDDSAETTQVVDKEVIEYFEMEVEREVVDNPLEWLDSRFEEIERKKKETRPFNWWNSSANFGYLNSYKDYNKANDIPKSTKEPMQQSLPFWIEKEDDDIPDFKDFNDKAKDLDDYTPNPQYIQRCVGHLLTCSLIPTTGKFNIKEFVEKRMDKLYENIFGDDDLAFETWVDFIVEYLIIYTVDPNLPKDRFVEDEDLYNAKAAEAMLNQIVDYQDNNHYIGEYCNRLMQYIEL